MTIDKGPQSNLGIELNDEVYTAADLEASIRSGLPAEKAAEINQTVNEIPRFVKDNNRPTIGSKAIAHHLKAARSALANVETKPNLASSPATATPVLGKLWGRIRGQMHELVLFYVNRLGGTSGRVDGQLIEAIEELTALVEQQQAEIEALKKERGERKE